MKKILFSFILLFTYSYTYINKAQQYRPDIMNVLLKINTQVITFLNKVQNNEPVIDKNIIENTNGFTLVKYQHYNNVPLLQIKLDDSWNHFKNSHFVLIPQYTNTGIFVTYKIYTDLDHQITPYIAFEPMISSTDNVDYLSFISYHYKTFLPAAIFNIFVSQPLDTNTIHGISLDWNAII